MLVWKFFFVKDYFDIIIEAFYALSNCFYKINYQSFQHPFQEALVLFFETASPEEIQDRLHEEVYVTHVEVAVG